MKHTHASDTVHGFLCDAYSLTAVFIDGFTSIVGLDILLFLFINAVTKLGMTSEDKANTVGATGTSTFHGVPLIAVLLSVPVFVYILAMGILEPVL